MSQYAETTDVTAYLTSDILAEITAASGTTPDSAVISDCITAASRRIDFILGERSYSAAEEEALKDPCCLIARRLLIERHGVARSLPDVIEAAKQAEDDLRAIAGGERGSLGTPATREVSASSPSWGSETIYYDGTVC